MTREELAALAKDPSRLRLTGAQLEAAGREFYAATPPPEELEPGWQERARQAAERAAKETEEPDE